MSLSGVRGHAPRAAAEHNGVQETHDDDVLDNIKQVVRRTFSTKELASQLVAPPETPNRHVGYINGVLHVFDDNVIDDPALSEDFARARATLIEASRRNQQSLGKRPTVDPDLSSGLNNVTPLENGVPIPKDSVALSAAATPVPTGSPGSSAFLTPPQLYYKVAETGQSKVTLPFGKVRTTRQVHWYNYTVLAGVAPGCAGGRVHCLWGHAGAVSGRQLPGTGCGQPRPSKGAFWTVWPAFWCHDGRHLWVRVGCQSVC